VGNHSEECYIVCDHQFLSIESRNSIQYTPSYWPSSSIEQVTQIFRKFSLSSTPKSHKTAFVKPRSEAIDEKPGNISYRSLANESSVNFLEFRNFNGRFWCPRVSFLFYFKCPAVGNEKGVRV